MALEKTLGSFSYFSRWDVFLTWAQPRSQLEVGEEGIPDPESSLQLPVLTAGGPLWLQIDPVVENR